MKKKWLIKIGILAGCMVLNVAGRLLASALSLPLWLDTIGTCVAAYFVGPVGGVIAGITNNVIFALQSPSELVYLFTSVAVALCFTVCVRRGYLESLTQAMISSFAVGIFAMSVSAPLQLLMHDGRSGNFWGDALFDMLDWYGVPKVLCTLAGSAIVEIVDKQISVGIAYGIIRLIRRSRGEKRQAEKILGPLLAAVVLLGAMAPAGTARAADRSEEDVFVGGYLGEIYDNTTGMPSSEANVIEETADGYIWIGSYAGLTRYDGKEFEFIRAGGIVSVTCMMTDREGRLWVGTNAGGVAIYEDGVFSFRTVEDGLPVNSVRSLTQGEDGTVYVGTTDRICAFSPDGTVTALTEEVNYVNSMVAVGNVLLGAANNGALYLLEGGAVTDTMEPEEGIYYTCVADTGLGVLAGTSAGYVERLTVEGGRLTSRGRIETKELRRLTRIGSDSAGRTWLCADTGFGYLDREETLHMEHFSGFDSSLECMHEDYQGNIWLCSSRCGVMKLSRNRFRDLFALSGTDSAVVNGVVPFLGDYYCGTDSGLVVLDGESLDRKENDLTAFLAGERVRSLMTDSEGDLWVSTYGKDGLVRLDGATGEIRSFTVETAGVTSDRFRCTVELADGVIAAGTNAGINFIRGDQVVGTITEEDGLRNSQILCMTVGEDGTLYAGTDGAGIYTIEDGAITGCISTEQGLSSDVVMRITPYREGYFLVASNSLCYMEGGWVRRLQAFPYFNNYDLLLYEDTAYVLGSSGIYRVDAEALKADRELTYQLYNSADGLLSGLTANAWNFIDETGTLFFCCNSGVTAFALEEQELDVPYKLGLASVTGDGEEIRAEEGVYTVPAGVKRITVKASVRNYALTDVKLRFYIEGLDEEAPLLSQSELEPIQISNLTHGTYAIHLQIVSDDESQIYQEETFTLVKEAQVWENPWYLIYLVCVGVWIIVFITWVVVMLVNMSRRKKVLEELRRELEETVEEQTEEIRAQAQRMTEFQWSVIESMASLIESRDGNTGQHVINTRNYVSLLAETLLEEGLYPEQLDRRFVDFLVQVAPLHDVGKIKISDVILNKPGRFTPEEYELMKRHAVYGGEIIGSILGKDADPEMVRIARDVAAYHHEKWDGSGYSAGLAGEQIPLAARIMAVADVFDALVAKRVYKDAMGVEEAFAILEEGAGKHFDPVLIRAFMSRKEEAARLAREGAEAARAAAGQAASGGEKEA